jgi:citrate lyase subunit beta / citryl-CoA lyase
VGHLANCVLAARAHALDILDGVYNDFSNTEGLRAECDQGRALGMDGKSLIHPGQVATANELFAPSQQEQAAARRILAAFARPENAGRGAISLDGQMVETLHAEMARRTIALADAIAAREVDSGRR